MPQNHASQGTKRIVFYKEVANRIRAEKGLPPLPEESTYTPQPKSSSNLTALAVAIAFATVTGYTIVKKMGSDIPNLLKDNPISQLINFKFDSK